MKIPSLSVYNIKLLVFACIFLVSEQSLHAQEPETLQPKIKVACYEGMDEKRCARYTEKIIETVSLVEAGFKSILGEIQGIEVVLSLPLEVKSFTSTTRTRVDRSEGKKMHPLETQLPLPGHQIRWILSAQPEVNEKIDTERLIYLLAGYYFNQKVVGSLPQFKKYKEDIENYWSKRVRYHEERQNLDKKIQSAYDKKSRAMKEKSKEKAEELEQESKANYEESYIISNKVVALDTSMKIQRSQIRDIQIRIQNYADFWIEAFYLVYMNDMDSLVRIKNEITQQPQDSSLEIQNKNIYFLILTDLWKEQLQPKSDLALRLSVMDVVQKAVLDVFETTPILTEKVFFEAEKEVHELESLIEKYLGESI